MRKLFAVIFLVIGVAVGVRAQLTHVELTLGSGICTNGEELFGKESIIALNIGPAFHVSFQNLKRSYADNLYVELFPNIARRGGKWHQEWPNIGTVRDGYIHALYLQCPVTAGYKFELPIRKPGHDVGFFIGPAFSLGFGGRYRDEQVTPDYTQQEVNYNITDFSDKSVKHPFKHFRRYDVSLMYGATYRHNSFTVNMYYDFGLIPLKYKTDALPTSISTANTHGNNNNNNNNNNNGTTGQQNQTSENNTVSRKEPKERNAFANTNRALMVSVAYHLSMGKK